MPKQADQKFLTEAKDLIETIGRDLLRYEEAMLAGGKINPDILNSVFRATHNLRGLTGPLGRRKMSSLAQAMENLLDRMRNEKVLRDPQALNTLFEALGRLFAMLPSDKEEDIIIDQILAKLKKFSKGKVSKAGDKKKREKENAKILKRAAIPKDILDILTEYEEFRLIKNIQDKSHLVIISVAFDLLKFEEGLPELLRWLKQFGEIITTWPAGDDIGDDKIHFEILLGTDKNLDKLSKLIKERGATLNKLKCKKSGKGR